MSHDPINVAENRCNGELGHLYRAAAKHVVTTLLQGMPEELHSAVLVPLSAGDPSLLHPIGTLRDQWLAQTSQ